MRKLSWSDEQGWHSRRSKGQKFVLQACFGQEKIKIKFSFYMLRSGPNRTRPQSVLGYNTQTTATCYGLEGPGIGSRWMWVFPHPYRPALTSTQPPIEWVTALFPGGIATKARRWTFTRSRAEVTERVQLYFYMFSGSFLRWTLTFHTYIHTYIYTLY